MDSNANGSCWRRVLLALLASVAAMLAPGVQGQVDFQIVWVTVGEAATAGREDAARAGRRLFGAGDLASLSLDDVRVSHVEVAPIVTQIEVGRRWCLSTLDMRAYGPDRELIPQAPLSISVRQDHRQHLKLRRSRQDICLRPMDPGEYPIRMTSLLPAPDDSMRGAQIFLRVSDPRGSSKHSRAPEAP
jgi:hypothetical protein